ncbi:MAG: hypothetical protein JW395_2595 [Nitrospira sp.]|nr:hypothetical protein [Nitrospira sp.]
MLRVNGMGSRARLAADSLAPFETPPPMVRNPMTSHSKPNESSARCHARMRWPPPSERIFAPSYQYTIDALATREGRQFTPDN